MVARGSRLVALAALAALASCSDGFFVTQFDVVITTPTTGAQFDTSSDTVALAGTFEYTLGVHEDLEITWHNLTTGASGPATVNVSVQTWSAGPVPLQDGTNQLRVDFDADGDWDDQALLVVVYTPGPLPVDGDVERERGSIVVPAGVEQGGASASDEPRELSGVR